MDEKDVKRLWALLDELYPRQKPQETGKRLLAWTLALEPYGYEEIRAAALSHARKNEYYPSIAEITANLPARKVTEQKPHGAGEAWQRAIDAGQCLDAADEMGAVSRCARERGVSWREAKQILQKGA